MKKFKKAIKLYGGNDQAFLKAWENALEATGKPSSTKPTKRQYTKFQQGGSPTNTRGRVSGEGDHQPSPLPFPPPSKTPQKRCCTGLNPRKRIHSHLRGLSLPPLVLGGLEPRSPKLPNLPKPGQWRTFDTWSGRGNQTRGEGSG